MNWFTVPADRTGRLSLVTLANNDTVSRLCGIGWGSGSLGAVLFIGSLASNTSWQGLQGFCIEDGDSLFAYCAAANAAYVSFSGSLLLGDPS